MLWFHSPLWINRVPSYIYTFLNPYSQIHFLTIVNSPVMIIFSSHIFFPYILIYPLSCYFILCTNVFVQFFNSSSLFHLSSRTLYTAGFKLSPVILALLLSLASYIEKLWACGGIVLAYFFVFFFVVFEDVCTAFSCSLPPFYPNLSAQFILGESRGVFLHVCVHVLHLLFAGET